MHPNVFITESFLDDLNESEQNLSKMQLHEDDSEKESQFESCKRVRNLLLSSNLKCNIKDNRLIKFYKMESGLYTDLKSLIIHRAIKDNRLYNHHDIKDFADKNIVYFIDKQIVDCNILSKENGVVISGKNFISQPFFVDHSFYSVTDDQISQINKAVHPCSSMVIIDPYIFIDNQKKVPKIPNLIGLLKKFIPKDFNSTFELDIITKNPENNMLVESKKNQILEAFKEKKISLHIYAPQIIENERDRHFITNYALYSSGHPLDGESYISGNFYPSSSSKDGVKNAFRDWSNKISKSIDIINSTPDKIGLIKCVWTSDNRKHKIFNCLKNEN